jgi:hypothetical protein
MVCVSLHRKVSLGKATEGEEPVGVIEALLGHAPEVYHLDPEQWAARVQFMKLTYDMLMMASQKEPLAMKDVNEVRKMSVLWGRAFLMSGFDLTDWTSYFHTFHEHLHWELSRFFVSCFLVLFLVSCFYFLLTLYHRYCLYERSSMVVESAIHEMKGISSKYRPFKNPRKGETRFWSILGSVFNLS